MSQTLQAVRPPEAGRLPAVRDAAQQRALRVVSMLAFAAIAASWVYNVGIPGSFLDIAIWAWLASIAWNIGKPLRSHLRFWRDWWGPLALLVAYNYTWGIADQVGSQVAVWMPIEVDTWLGGGELPTVRLQEAFCGGICSSSEVQWFDYLFSVVYMSHFFMSLGLAGVLWIRNRDAWSRWMRRYLLLIGTALVVYVVYPMAPPWMARENGAIEEPIVRLTARGWESFGIPVNAMLTSRGVNEVAAMPSLHAALSLLVALWFVRRARHRLRWLALLYPTVMGTTLVFYADHYVIDLVAGFLLVAAVEIVCSLWERSAGSRRPRQVVPPQVTAPAEESPGNAAPAAPFVSPVARSSWAIRLQLLPPAPTVTTVLDEG